MGYDAALKRAAERFRERADRTDVLFFLSTCSVDRQRLPAFRDRLRELVIDFVSQAEESEGDGVTELVIGFAPTPGSCVK